MLRALQAARVSLRAHPHRLPAYDRQLRQHVRLPLGTSTQLHTISQHQPIRSMSPHPRHLGLHQCRDRERLSSCRLLLHPPHREMRRLQASQLSVWQYLLSRYGFQRHTTQLMNYTIV